MAERRRLNLRGILADADLRRELMVPTIQATQAREGIETTREQAERAYYVVTEEERVTFIDLARSRGAERAESDWLEARFVSALQGAEQDARIDVPRRDFSAIPHAPLAYRMVGLASHVFREAPALEPAWGRVRMGLSTGDDARWVRYWWEVAPCEGWIPFAVGRDSSRFYATPELVIAWKPEEFRRAPPELYSKPGLTWPRTGRHLSVQLLPAGTAFSDKRLAILPSREQDTDYLLAVMNSRLAEYVLQALAPFSSWGTRHMNIAHLPIHEGSAAQRSHVAERARGIHEAKARWDQGNELNPQFSRPWLLLPELMGAQRSIGRILDKLAEYEASQEARIRQLYAELNDEVYRLYGIPGSSRESIEASIGGQPTEAVWPQMEGSSVEQKRMEHVWRLLSYTVKRILEADADGLVLLGGVSDEPRLADRVRSELGMLFPDRDAAQVEIELVNELRRSVEGYRSCQSLDEWLENAFFEFHCRLYKDRPIFWHIASARGTRNAEFSALVHYHRFDKDLLARLRWYCSRQPWTAEVRALDEKLQWIQEGRYGGPEGDFRILAPWKELAERSRGWDPNLNDGVEVNIGPLERAGVLRTNRGTRARLTGALVRRSQARSARRRAPG